jgi:NAD(P)-dependent dehydrogenase (short-subunit alcohol dehydrogenase family)
LRRFVHAGTGGRQQAAVPARLDREHQVRRTSALPAAEALRARGGDVEAITLDVTGPATITDAAALIGRDYGRLDILVNNAGISGNRAAQRPGNVDLDNVRAIFETNLFGVIAVTEAMLPLLRKAASARIVNVSSGTGSLTWMTDPEHYFASLPGSAAYPVSKTALNMLTVQYAKTLAAENITVRPAASSTTTGGCPGDDDGRVPW